MAPSRAADGDVVFSGESGWQLATYERANDESEGGSATIRWTVNGNAEPDFHFNILGKQDPSTTKTKVDSFYGPIIGQAWFWGNILDQESSGRQYYSSSGLPLATGTPDGIGISQIEGTVNAPTDLDYWNYEANIEDGIAILNGTQNAAYSHYNGLVTTHGYPPFTSSNDGDSLADCQFSSTASGSVHSWKDAEWITSYNGNGGVVIGGVNVYPKGYYIEWNGTSYYVNKDAPTVYSAHGSYVGDVCNKAAY